MTMTLSPAQRADLERSLSEVARRIDGAIDFWPLVCLGSFPTDRRGFLSKHQAAVGAAVAGARAVLAEAAVAEVEPVRGLLDSLAERCQRFGSAFFALEQFRTLPLDEVRSAADGIADGYAGIREAVLQLGRAAGVPVAYWEGARAGREEYFQSILRGLFATCRHERGDVPRPAPATPD